MREPRFPLRDAAQMFLDDIAFEVKVPTWRTYRSWIMKFVSVHKTLADLTPANAERFIRDSKSQHTAMNKAIALKRWTRYLAEKKIWYESVGERRISVLSEVKQPRPLGHGQAPYTDEEVRAIQRAVNDGAEAARYCAVVAVELHGLRSKECWKLQLRGVVLPTYKEKGHLVIEDSKTPSGYRSVPLEPQAVAPIRDYIRQHRPTYLGTSADGPEPLFISDDGHPLDESGWNSQAQRIRRMVAHEGIPFRQHRLRSTSVRLAHESEWPDSVNIAAHGWSARTGQQMLARYRGPIPVEQMKKYPNRFDRVMRSA